MTSYFSEKDFERDEPLRSNGVVLQGRRSQSICSYDTDGLDIGSGMDNNNNVEYENIYDILEDVPISTLTVKERKSLGTFFDQVRPSGDYRELASILFPELNDGNMYAIAKKKEPTKVLLEKWAKEKKSQATVSELVKIAYSMRRLDVVKYLVTAAEGHVGKIHKKRHFLTGLKRKLFKEDDTMSVSSVLSSTGSMVTLGSLSSSPSSASLSSYASYTSIEQPLKEGFMPIHDNRMNFHARLGKQDSKSQNTVNSQNSLASRTVFLVSACDQVDNLVLLVKKLRTKGVEAKSIHTDKVEYYSNPCKYVSEQLATAEYVLVMISPQLKMALDRNHGQDDPQHLRYIFEYLNMEWFSGKSCVSKYIPVMGTKTAKSDIPMPLKSAVESFFETKENLEDLLRRLNKVEKYKLPAIGSKPIIKQNIITGEFANLRM